MFNYREAILAHQLECARAVRTPLKAEVRTVKEPVRTVRTEEKKLQGGTSYYDVPLQIDGHRVLTSRAGGKKKQVTVRVY